MSNALLEADGGELVSAKGALRMLVEIPKKIRKFLKQVIQLNESYTTCPYRNLQEDPSSPSLARLYTARETRRLTEKIDAMLQHNQHGPTSTSNNHGPIGECYKCKNRKELLEYLPCHHRSHCRPCFLKGIKNALATHSFPVRCPVCMQEIQGILQNHKKYTTACSHVSRARYAFAA